MSNALLKINEARARRMSEPDALDLLRSLGFVGAPTITGRSSRKGGKAEEIRYQFDRFTTRPDGSPRYDRARLTVTFSI